MKPLKITIIILVLCLVSIPLLVLGCRAEAESPEYQTVTVQRGDLTVDITSVGNLALSDKVDLAFEMDGTVEEVLVTEAEFVEEGQLLAKLDTSAWEDYVAGLEDKVTTAERNVTAKERAVTTAERQIVTKKLDLLQAQVNLQTAEDNLNKVGVIADANKAVDDAEYNLRIAQAMFQQASLSEMLTTEANFWMSQINNAQTRFAEAKKEQKEILTGSSVKVTTDVATALAINQLQVEIAQGRLEDANTAIKDAEKGVGDAKTAVEDAKTAVEDAKTAVEDAKNTSPEITAPFAGFIIKVNVKGGDIVKKGTVAVVIADPTKFEADIMVNEMDLLRVKLGGEARVQVDAVPGLSLSANVTHISPTATIQQGVVNYKVKVEIQSLPETMTEQPETMPRAILESQSASDNISAGAPAGGFRQPSVGDNLTQPPGALFRGFRQAPMGENFTQQQLEAMRQQRQQAQAEPSAGQPAPMPTTASQNLQLREGLTITVSIVTQQKSNVLLVPNTAITTKQGQAYVQVLSTVGATTERPIQAGISNWQYTEVTSGLSEGEQVIVPKATAITPTTQQQGGQGGIRVPGMGGFGR